MLKRSIAVLFIAVLVLGMLPGTLAAQDAAPVVVAVGAVEDAVIAWADAYDGDLELVFVADDAAVLAYVEENAAAAVIREDYEAELPVEAVSRVYMPLPGYGAQALAEETEAFLQFAVSPDGQQIAIDLGLLPESVEVVDQAGETVVVPQPVRVIVSAYGVTSFYPYALGAGDRVAAGAFIGVREPVAPNLVEMLGPGIETAVSAVSVIGQRETNLEEVAALDPDVIFAAARTQWLDAAAELGVSIIRFEGEGPDELKEAFALAGAVLGPDAEFLAAQFNAYYDEVFAQILEQTSGLENPVTVYFSGTEPLRTASGDMYQTDMIEAAGAVSVSAELTGFWNDVNLEQVTVWNPDVIIVPPYGGANVEAFTESEEWNILPAVQEGSLITMPKLAAPWDTPVPDSILGIIWMAETLYPDDVTLNCEAETEYFYNTFYGYDIPEEEVQALCQ